MEKYCVNCKWNDVPFCNNPKLTFRGRDSVTGKWIIQTLVCANLREDEVGACGKKAKYFEPKETFLDKVKGFFNYGKWKYNRRY